MNRRRVGSEKEALVCKYLEEKGYRIVVTNYWCRIAEIDIVANDGDVLVFVEVKYRKNAACGGSMYAVGFKKRRKIYRCARYYINKEGIAPDTPMRFDVGAIDGEQVVHVENAFDAI